jgi:5-methyltetrahydrofolate--homocysteine methyltransferase
VEEIARSYLEAGADLLQTNTFGASPIRLALYSLEERTEEINRVAAEAVKRIAGDRAYTVGSCGPCGRLLRPLGDLEPEEVRSSFLKQIGALVESGVDAVCIETMSDIREARIAVEAAKDVEPTLPVFATMTFDQCPKGFYTIMGASVDDCARELEAAGADVVGSNCGNGSEKMVAIARRMGSVTELPLVIQPNAGMPVSRGGELVYLESPEFMAEQAKALVSVGVSIIGGCCGTTPEHVRAIREMLDSASR